MDIFDDTDSGLVPRYFIVEQESLEWLEKAPKVSEIVSAETPQLIVDHIGDRVRLSVEVDTDEFDEYIYLFNKLWKARMLSIDVAQRFLTLTPREKDILRLLMRGRSNEYISDALSISLFTVKTHRKNIYRKLCCTRIEDLMRFSSLI